MQEVILGDSFDVMAGLRPVFSAVVTDPPYSLGFMGKEWDRLGSESFERWTERWARLAFDLLLPGGHVLAFGAPRTYHRLACGLEDAGFEIRDCVGWWFGSGFPKSLDVSAAIDGALGAERERVALDGATGDVYGEGINVNFAERPKGEAVTDEAKAWEGWGTALKPAWEPCVVARKPLAGTIAETVLQYGTGGINVDGCRIGHDEPEGKPSEGLHGRRSGGRWPANVILSHSTACERVGERSVRPRNGSGRAGNSAQPTSSMFGAGGGENSNTRGQLDADGFETVEDWRCADGCPVAELDRQSGASVSSGGRAALVGMQRMRGEDKPTLGGAPGLGDFGGASRFFYTAKASRSEREAWGRMAMDPRRRSDGRAKDIDNPRLRTTERVNDHPTVKPLDLMEWLLRLVVPEGGLVLDPFTGSGSTLVAARRARIDCVGIERDARNARIARARLDAQWEQRLF